MIQNKPHTSIADIIVAGDNAVTRTKAAAKVRMQVVDSCKYMPLRDLQRKECANIGSAPHVTWRSDTRILGLRLSCLQVMHALCIRRSRVSCLCQ